jgi:hypothetical protein
VREQYHHAIDVVPTILECAGIEFPEVVNGYEQTPLPGVSMRYSFDSAGAPTTKHTQYYSMLGTRGIWHEGWKAVAERGPTSGIGHFDQDRWFEEAGKYDVLPLDDRTPMEILLEERAQVVPPRGVYTYYAGTSMVSERTAANTHSRSFRILADVEVTADSDGVIAAQGSRFGGWSLFMKGGKLWYAYNFLGIPPEQQYVSPEPLSAGRHVVGMEFTKESTGEHKESHGTTRLYVDDQPVAEGPMRTQPGHFSLCGEGLTIGRDAPDPVSAEYSPGSPFTGGTINKVEIAVGDDGYLDLETEAVAMMARE